MPFHLLLSKVMKGMNLNAEESESVFDDIFNGFVSEDDLASFLLSLAKKGETADELLGAVISMRAKMLTIKAPPDAMDIVGTGGDLTNTLNISTATALVVAACGVPVAKHGNRAVTSRSGSSDILAALGVNLEPSLDTLEECLNQANLCFLFAPRHHPTLKYVSNVRKKLGIRTIFNLLGPLTNPANVKKHLIGVYETECMGVMADVLKNLDSETAWFVHGHDDMDEITTTTTTDVVELKNRMVRHFTLSPEQVGLPRAVIDDIYGGDAQHNATELRRLLRGHHNPYRDIVVFNAGAALCVSGKCVDIRQGMRMAAYALDTGGAYDVLDKVVRLSNQSYR